MANKCDYDVIIIGAGISGLVCGCYLAKAGMKTLIVEKNTKPGGYCTSFTRNGFHFDAFVHALSSLRKEGLLNRYLNDLGIIDRLKFNRHNPSNIVITPEFKINIFHETNRTIDEFQKYFPKEKDQIKKFFEYIALSNSFSDKRSKTLDELLDFYFRDKKLKAILSFVVSILVGIDSSQVSALVACLLYKEFIFDGGYYPVGGMQTFSDTLLKRFNEFRGKAILGKMVKKIKIENNRVKGLILNNNQYVFSKYIVSACDAKQTFFELIGKNKTDTITKNKVDTAIPSSSFFLTYLGVNKKLQDIQELNSNIFLTRDYNLEKITVNFLNCSRVSIRVPSIWDKTLNKNGQESACLLVNVNYKNKEYWNEQKKEAFADRLIRLAETIIPDLSKYIVLKTSITPVTLYKWTRNYQGAAFGWASTPTQFGNPDFSQKTKIENLYLAGHWSNQSSGVSLVANCGRDAANLILQKERRP